MPQFIDMRKRSAREKYKRELIEQDLLRCYQLLRKEEAITPLIHTHIKLINRLALITHNKKRPTLDLLVHYKNTVDKAQALSVFTNSLNNKGLFSKFLTVEEKTEKRWNSCGSGHTC
jgi:hypothetical protein